MDETKKTWSVYQQPEVVAQYERDEDLLPEEEHLFARYVDRARHVLDLGVGAGRTTQDLAGRAASYVGADYAPAMVERCQARFPSLRFVVADARLLSDFSNEQFDVVVFSFNGLGTLQTDEDRRQALSQVHRVLRPKGHFIFSLHNPRFFLFPWRPVARSLTKSAWRLAYSAFQTTQNAIVRTRSGLIGKESGYVNDPGQHGRLRVFTSSPKRTVDELRSYRFDLTEGPLPPESGPYQRATTPHYYYCFEKS
jgi:SAM-dependent methyltransferase